jgi:hypothetical protein
MAMQSFLENDESKANETNFCCLKSEFRLNYEKIRGSTLNENLSTNTTTRVDRRWTSPLILRSELENPGILFVLMSSN